MSIRPDPNRIGEGTHLWEASAEQKVKSNVSQYMAWLNDTQGLEFHSYSDLWRWSVTEIEDFWQTLWIFFEVNASRSYDKVLTARLMPGAHWFPGAKLNYAEHLLARADDHLAIVSQSELRSLRSTTYRELRREVASVASGLRALGVGKGDRVASFMPNILETAVAMLATSSIGAIWSSCSPDFGPRSVVDRLQQIEPRVLFVVDGYRYSGRDYSLLKVVEEVQSDLRTLEHTVVVPYLARNPDLGDLSRVCLWADLKGPDTNLRFEQVPFEHPLWILYSSGTTGLPKAIVHGHGGVLLEHMKTLSLHMDLTSDDRFFWFTTTGWMMWNLLLSGLSLGSTVVLFDGDPSYSDLGTLWRLAQDAHVSYFGASAPYIQACMKAGIKPSKAFDLSTIRGVGCTGAPLPPEGFRWVYEDVNPDVHFGSYSGGTDMCTGFVGPSPLLPVCAGQIQCRTLGALVEAYDDQGHSLIDEVGELVITQPMPSMPLRLWGDHDGSLYRESYFEMYPSIWRHGDWIKITAEERCVIYGRSDSTLNRNGVRMGTSEFYGVVEEMDEITDSLVIDTGYGGREDRLLLFVVLKGGVVLDEPLRSAISAKLRVELSPRHVPDEIRVITEVPRTLNGKKIEVPVKRILTGSSVTEAVSEAAIANPDSLRVFVRLAGSSSMQFTNTT